MSESNPHTVCIIGGGMSGLFTGALLAKNGYQVTILEKNHIIGGGLQSFHRGDVVFDTGLHIVTGYNEKMVVKHFFDYIGLKNINVLYTNPNAQDIIWIDPKHSFQIPRGRRQCEDYLVQHFPQESNGIHALMDEIYFISCAFDYMWMKKICFHAEIIKYVGITAEQLIKKYISDKTLISLFNYIGLYLGKNIANASAIEYCPLMVLFVEGSCRFKGGNAHIVKRLVDCIHTHGGRVLADEEVVKLNTNNNQIVSVETIKHIFMADVYVCSTAPINLIRQSRASIFKPATKERIVSHYNDSSFFAIFIELHKETFPFINSSVLMEMDLQNEIATNFVYLITPPSLRQGKWAKTLDILVPISCHKFQQWSDSNVEDRGDDYQKKKDEFANEVIDFVSGFYPLLKGSIKHYYTGTSLTIRDYYRTPHGSLYGQQGLFIPIKTKLTNLFMTGQAIQYQGIAGVTTTSILTAETILGKSLIDEIAKA